MTAVNVANPVETFRPVTEYIGGSLGGPMRGELNRDQSERRWVVYDVNARTERSGAALSICILARRRILPSDFWGMV